MDTGGGRSYNGVCGGRVWWMREHTVDTGGGRSDYCM